MELSLQHFIECTSKIIDVKNLDDRNPFILMLTDGVAGHTTKYAVVASKVEPVDWLKPINATWINFNPTSKYYRQALRLVGLNGAIDPNVTIDPEQVLQDDNFVHSWVKVKRYADIFAHPNIYYLQGPAGPRGPQGLQGLTGPTGPLDNPAIVAESIIRVNAALALLP